MFRICRFRIFRNSLPATLPSGSFRVASRGVGIGAVAVLCVGRQNIIMSINATDLFPALNADDPPLLASPTSLLHACFVSGIIIFVAMVISTLQPLAQGARVASTAATSYSNLEPRTNSWMPYSTHISSLIAAAHAGSTDGGQLRLPDLPFEVRWGSRATSWRMPQAPPTGMIQVNVNNGNTRVVRCEAADASTAASFDARILCKTRTFRASNWRWMRHLDFPWLHATFEGESFEKFIFVLMLESLLNATNTANTYLEGDLFFSDDPHRIVVCPREPESKLVYSYRRVPSLPTSQRSSPSCDSQSARGRCPPWTSSPSS